MSMVVEARPDVIDARLQAIVDAAIDSLVDELMLAPKPGLVCPESRGSHVDMDFGTMQRSIVSLRPGFGLIVDAAADGADFDRLKHIGIEAERAMRLATGGVNTHRGAIFNLGLIAASAAVRTNEGMPLTAKGMRDTLRARFVISAPVGNAGSRSHGEAAAARYGAGGARSEAIDGFPTVFVTLWPALVSARARMRCDRRAAIHVLMMSFASTTDTNLLYRGGKEGLAFAHGEAKAFLERGGVGAIDWEARLSAIGDAFVTRNLSPGGSADLLAATLFVDRLVRLP